MPLAAKGAYALILVVGVTEQGRGEAIMPRRAESDQDSQCSATATRKATRRMTQLYDDALAPAGLRSTQYAIVDELHRKADAPPTLGELAETLVPDRSALGYNLRPLERDGLIALVAGDADRRLRRVVLTKIGRQADAGSARLEIGTGPVQRRVRRNGSHETPSDLAPNRPRRTARHASGLTDDARPHHVGTAETPKCFSRKESSHDRTAL
jgi:DNA-binding MarR family transcriptional regulator